MTVSTLNGHIYHSLVILPLFDLNEPSYKLGYVIWPEITYVLHCLGLGTRDWVSK